MKDEKEIKVWGDKNDKSIKIKLSNIHTHIYSYNTGSETWIFMSPEHAEELAHDIYQQIQELDDGKTT